MSSNEKYQMKQQNRSNRTGDVWVWEATKIEILRKTRAGTKPTRDKPCEEQVHRRTMTQGEKVSDPERPYSRRSKR